MQGVGSLAGPATREAPRQASSAAAAGKPVTASPPLARSTFEAPNTAATSRTRGPSPTCQALAGRTATKAEANAEAPPRTATSAARTAVPTSCTSAARAPKEGRTPSTTSTTTGEAPRLRSRVRPRVSVAATHDASRAGPSPRTAGTCYGNAKVARQRPVAGPAAARAVPTAGLAGTARQGSGLRTKARLVA